MDINNNKLSCWNNNRLCDKEFDEMKKKNNNYKIEIYDGDDNKKYVLLDDFKVVLKAGQDIRKEYENLKELYDVLIKDLEIAETRNNKAIEYINDLRDESAEREGFYNCFPDDLYIANIEDLLDILRGEDNEKDNDTNNL